MMRGFLGRCSAALSAGLGLILLTQLSPLVSADDTFTYVSDLVRTISLACLAIVVPLILLGLVLGYIQVAGPWGGMRTLRKSGRTQIEMGYITLFLFIITPAIFFIIMEIGKSLGGGWPQT